eukprot:COSAG02_NODE_3271_length_7032_cov_60.609028_1_plen_213_part_00
MPVPARARSCPRCEAAVLKPRHTVGHTTWRPPPTPQPRIIKDRADVLLLHALLDAELVIGWRALCSRQPAPFARAQRRQCISMFAPPLCGRGDCLGCRSVRVVRQGWLSCYSISLSLSRARALFLSPCLRAGGRADLEVSLRLSLSIRTSRPPWVSPPSASSCPSGPVCVIVLLFCVNKRSAPIPRFDKTSLNVSDSGMCAVCSVLHVGANS